MDELPKSEQGWIPTLNQMGYMTDTLSDPYSIEFVESCKKAQHPVLEIGAAFGVATIPALCKGAKVIANDIEPKHLDIIKKRTPEEYQSNLTLNAQRFPEVLQLRDESLSAILVSRVLHFFSGDKIEISIKKMHSWLVPGGRVYVVAETPFTRFFVNFEKQYQERKERGEKWPGYITDLRRINKSRASALPNEFHVLEPDILGKAFLESGFSVNKGSIFPRPDFPKDIQLDGREGMGLIAEKLVT